MSSSAPIDKVLAALRSRRIEPKGKGPQFMAQCPAHDDAKPSLSVGTGDDGRALIRCHAGCSVGSVVGSLGLTLRDLMPPHQNGVGKRSRAAGKKAYLTADQAIGAAMRAAKATLVATWTYTDMGDNVVLIVARGEPKTYRPISKWTDGWRICDPDGALPLYAIQQLARQDTVYVVEGEKCADVARSIGLNATTSAYGAKSASKSDWSPLAGKQIVIFPDNDEAGRQYACDVSQLLTTLSPPATVRVVCIPGLGAGEDIADHVERERQRGVADEVIRAAIESLPETPLPNPRVATRDSNGSRSTLGSIQVQGGTLPEQVEKAEAALRAQTLADPNRGVYARGSTLVRPATIDMISPLRTNGINRPDGAVVLVPVDANLMQLLLTECIDWDKLEFSGGESELIPIDAPLKVARAVISKSSWSSLPGIVGLVHAPLLRADGTVLSTPGYDEASNLLFDPRGTEFPAIPERPSRRDAEAALALLKEPFEEFSFVDEASRSVAIAAVMTAVLRKTLPTAPLIGFSAPKMASGKSLLAAIPSYVATGLPPSFVSQADDTESERKRYLALLLESAGVVVIDNAERPVKSETLCILLTSQTFTDRLLGVSKTVTVPTNSLFMVTGNNLTIEGDLTSRTLLCELDPACERPEERRFDRNLHHWVPENRGALASAVLTAVQAYRVDGCPDVGLAPFGRFEEWSLRIRQPLVWLGCGDPCKTREKIERRDPIREQLVALQSAWYETFHEQPVPAREVVEACVSPGGGRLKDAVEDVAADGRGLISAKRLGRFLAAHSRRIEHSLRFEPAGAVQGAIRWRVRRMGPMLESEV